MVSRLDDLPPALKERIPAAKDGTRTILDLYEAELDSSAVGKLLVELDLPENATLEQVNIAHNFAGDAGAKLLGLALKAGSRIPTFDLQHNQIGDAGFAEIGEGIKTNRYVRKLMLAENPVTDQGIRALAEGLAVNRSVCSLWLGKDPHLSEEAQTMLEEALMNTGSKNICEVSGFGSMELKRRCQSNWDKALVLTKQIKSDKESLTPRDTQEIRERTPAMRFSRCPQWSLDQYEAYLDTLPTVKAEGVIRVEDLFTQDEATGKAPIENYRTWESFETICQRLQKAGDPLTTERLRAIPIDEEWEETALDYCLKHAPLPPLMAGLRIGGEKLQADFLLSGEGKPSADFQTIIRNKETQLLFTKENWQGADPGELRAVIRAMPDQAREQVKNLNTLTSSLEREQAQTRRGR